MSSFRPTLWRRLALLLAVAALAVAVAACGSSSGGSSASTASTGGGAEPTEAEAELAGIMRLQIYGKFGGTKNEFHVLEGGACRIVKINTNPADVKADGEAVLDHEKNASVVVEPKDEGSKSATEAECRKAVESAIG
jgi:hypothetical protein